MKKKRVILWGMGNTMRDFLEKRCLYKNLEIVAFTDNNASVWNTKYRDIQVIAPTEIEKISYDLIIICSLYYKEIFQQLIHELSVDCKKIISCFQMEEKIKDRLIEKYEDSSNEEIKNVLEYFRRKALNVYGNYEGKKQYYMVNRDQNAHPYIMFEGKRMYYPDTYKFNIIDGKQYVADVLYEQMEGSPHQYIRNSDEIKNGSVIVDAGVCEGNFALRYIDIARKIYLIESDAMWMEALRRTFHPYENKVMFCSKFLDRYDSKNTITIDSLIKEKIDFLKLDIEGSEIDALLGARETLERSDARCAICSYHKQNDERYIKFLLEAYGYHTDTSKGYMFFLYDENVLDTLDLRKGVVYGEKR